MWLLSGAVFPAKNASFWGEGGDHGESPDVRTGGGSLEHVWLDCRSDHGSTALCIVSGHYHRFGLTMIYRVLSPPAGIVEANMKRALLCLLLVTACSRKAILPVMNTVPEFTLTERSSREGKTGNLAEQIWIADFVYRVAEESARS